MNAPPNSMQSLPLELLDMILMKAAARLVKLSWEETGYQMQADMYKHLATVWSEWYNRLTTRWFNIVLKQKLLRYNPLSKFMDKPALVTKIDVGHSVWGLALLNKELYVASINTQSLLVYDPLSFKEVRTVLLEDEGVAGPRDIAAYQPKNCLFVVNVFSGSSLLCTDSQGKTIRKWELTYVPHNISVTPSGNLLLTCNARILEYNLDGTLLRDLGLDAESLDMSWHTILLNSGGFLVCQGWIDSRHHRLLRLDETGKVIRSYGTVSCSLDGHLSDPVYLALDRDSCIFVADSSNHRVVLFNKQLVFLKSLITDENDLFEPYRVLLDEPSGRLYVGTNDRQLHVFRVFK